MLASWEEWNEMSEFLRQHLDERTLSWYPTSTVSYGTGKTGVDVISETTSTRNQQTHDRIRAAAQRLFLQHGYLATSTDAILAEAGISSKETLYRHYASKEVLFVDVLSQLSMGQPSFSSARSALPTPRDLPTLREALTTLARELLTLMCQAEYIALLRIMVAEAPRLQHLGPLFLSAIPQRGIALVSDLLQTAKDAHAIADVNVDAVSRMLLGGLLTCALPSLLMGWPDAEGPLSEQAEAMVEIAMRAVAPEI